MHGEISEVNAAEHLEQRPSEPAVTAPQHRLIAPLPNAAGKACVAWVTAAAPPDSAKLHRHMEQGVVGRALLLLTPGAWATPGCVVEGTELRRNWAGSSADPTRRSRSWIITGPHGGGNQEREPDRGRHREDQAAITGLQDGGRGQEPSTGVEKQQGFLGRDTAWHHLEFTSVRAQQVSDCGIDSKVANACCPTALITA